MPWPVYLAFKHLFPTGRGLSWASVRASLKIAVIGSTGFFLLLMAFLWWNGALARIYTEFSTKLDFAEHLAGVWFYLTAGVAFVVILFRCTPFFNAMSILGIMLGVTVLITVQSVMNGFSYQYEQVFIETQGNLKIQTDGLIPHPDEVVRLVKQVPGVKMVEPVAFGVVMLQYQDRPDFPQVRSFDVNSPDAAHNPLAGKIDGAATIDNLDDQSVLIGSSLAMRLGVHPGEKLDISTPLMLDQLKKNEVPMPWEPTVAGTFTTDFAMYDDNTIIVTLRRMQLLYGLGDEVHDIEVRLDNDDIGHTLDVRDAIAQKLEPLNKERVAAGLSGPLEVETWEQANHDQMQILGVEKMVMFYIMIVIVIVAAFCILCSLATSVVRKTREIGVLGALGARPTQLAAVFCLQGLIIGMVGTALGVALSFFLLHFRQNIVDAFVNQRLMVEFYKFYEFPVRYHTADFINIIGFTFIITILAGLVPAWWAARLKPADCLRYE